MYLDPFPTAPRNQRRFAAGILIGACLFSSNQVSILRNGASESSAFRPQRDRSVFGILYTLAFSSRQRVGSDAHIRPMAPQWPFCSGQVGCLPPATRPRGRLCAVRRSPERDVLPVRPISAIHFLIRVSAGAPHPPAHQGYIYKQCYILAGSRL